MRHRGHASGLRARRAGTRVLHENEFESGRDPVTTTAELKVCPVRVEPA